MPLGDFYEHNVKSIGAVPLNNSISAVSVLTFTMDDTSGLLLPAEDLDVIAAIEINVDPSVTLTERHITLELVPNALATVSPNFGATNANHAIDVAGQASVVLSGTRRFNFRGMTGPFTIYANVKTTWTGSGNVQSFGYIRARSFG